MSQPVGTIGWCDLTVPDADSVRDFYKSVVGWTADAVDLGDYSDYCMMAAGKKDAVAGICHARGPNADVPPVWLMYIIVADLPASLKAVAAGGGTVLRGPTGNMAVIRDPAGAICAIIEAERAG